MATLALRSCFSATPAAKALHARASSLSWAACRTASRWQCTTRCLQACRHLAAAEMRQWAAMTRQAISRAQKCTHALSALLRKRKATDRAMACSAADSRVPHAHCRRSERARQRLSSRCPTRCCIWSRETVCRQLPKAVERPWHLFLTSSPARAASLRADLQARRAAKSRHGRKELRRRETWCHAAARCSVWRELTTETPRPRTASSSSRISRMRSAASSSGSDRQAVSALRRVVSPRALQAPRSLAAVSLARACQVPRARLRICPRRWTSAAARISCASLASPAQASIELRSQRRPCSSSKPRISIASLRVCVAATRRHSQTEFLTISQTAGLSTAASEEGPALPPEHAVSGGPQASFGSLAAAALTGGSCRT
mmetsp:Transcript_11963/g.33672  ORF Transcript_11963/g.33672 Transcript_11963/m.33672 type:complete len:374 (+) Transcript_11963:2301-3422(+)